MQPAPSNIKNWSGPSDFGNPEGAPFPAGTYTFSVLARGTYIDPDGKEQSFEVSASREFHLIP